MGRSPRQYLRLRVWQVGGRAFVCAGAVAVAQVGARHFGQLLQAGHNLGMIGGDIVLLHCIRLQVEEL